MKYTRIIVIGASAGGFEPLARIVSGLPEDFAVPVVVVQHLPPGQTTLLPRMLAQVTRLPVREAEDRTHLTPGVFTAPPGYHLLVESRERLGLSVDEPEEYSRPSINVLFESAAEIFRAGTIGIALSCASRDGVEGMRRILQAGGLTMVQNPAEALASHLPEAIIRENLARLILSANEMSAALLRECRTPQVRSGHHDETQDPVG